MVGGDRADGAHRFAQVGLVLPDSLDGYGGPAVGTPVGAPGTLLGLCGKSSDGYEHCTHKGAPQPCVRFVTQKDGPIRIIWIEIGFNESPNGIASHKLRLGLWTVGQRERRICTSN